MSMPALSTRMTRSFPLSDSFPSRGARFDSLETISYSISNACYSATMVQSSYTISTPHILRDSPRTNISFSGDLRATFYELGRSRHDERSETTSRTGEPDFGEGRWRGRGVGEKGQGAIVGYEEKGIERAISEYGSCCAYAMKLKSTLCAHEFGTSINYSPLTSVPAFSNCPRKLRCGAVTAVEVASAFETTFPACNRVFTRSSGLPMMMPTAPET
jgi:hypothetical protein